MPSISRQQISDKFSSKIVKYRTCPGSYNALFRTSTASIAPIVSKQDQRHLEARYEKLIAQRSTLKGLANKSRYKEVSFHVGGVNGVAPLTFTAVRPQELS